MKSNLISFLLVLGISLTGLSLTACNDNNENSSEKPDAELKETVMGRYAGHVTITTDAAPEKTVSTQPVTVETNVGIEAIEFIKFPLDALVEAIAGEENASEILETIGKIQYNVDYEIHRGEVENTLSVSLSPEPLEISLPITPTPHAESANGLIVRIQIAAPREGIFESELETMQFTLKVEGVTVNGEPFEMEPLELVFGMEKVKIGHHS